MSMGITTCTDYIAAIRKLLENTGYPGCISDLMPAECTNKDITETFEITLGNYEKNPFESLRSEQ